MQKARGIESSKKNTDLSTTQGYTQLRGKSLRVLEGGAAEQSGEKREAWWTERHLAVSNQINCDGVGGTHVLASDPLDLMIYEP